MKRSSSALTRRQWFRLGKPKSGSGSLSSTEWVNRDKTESIGARSRLKPVAKPPNHHGMDEKLLPPMREAILSKLDVEVLFDDISCHGTEILLMQRSVGRDHANASLPTLDQMAWARSALFSGQIQRVQIRYRWQDQFWIDTLKRQPEGFHIVRIAHHSK